MRPENEGNGYNIFYVTLAPVKPSNQAVEKSYSERLLIKKVLEGDQQSIRKLVETYQTLIYSIAYKILGNREDAEDACQETFMKGFRHLSSFQGESALGTWFYRIAYRSSLDMLKKRRKSVQLDPPEYNIALETEEDFSEPENGMDLKKTKLILKQAIERLDPDDAILVMLHYFQGLTLKETGNIMYISEGNAKVRLHRIRQKLFGMLKTKNIHQL